MRGYAAITHASHGDRRAPKKPVDPQAKEVGKTPSQDEIADLLRGVS